MKTNIIANNTVINTIMKSYIKYLCAVLLVIGTSAHAWGSQVSIQGSGTDSWTYTSSQIAITKDGVTLAAKGYSEGSVLSSEIRVNNGGTITISASQPITAVEFTITSASMFTQVDWDGNWTGSSTSVDFTAGSGQVVFTKVKVTIGGYVTLHDFAGDRMVAVGSTLPSVRMGTLKGWSSANLWSAATTTSAYPAYAYRYNPGDEAPEVHDLWAVYQNDCDYTYSTSPTSVYHISSTAPASTSGGGTGYVKAYVNSVETYCNIPAGTTVEIRATEESPAFVNWTVTKDGDGSTVVSVASSTSATTTFTMPSYNVSLTGNFGACSAPVVSNTGMTVITYPNDAGFRVQGGRVTTKNGTITQYGWAYSTSHNPTTSSTHWTISADVAANTTWAYYGDATGLTPGGTYYLRAYATNNCGETGYGPEVTIVQPYYITINVNGGTSAGSSGAYVKPNATTLTTITNAPTRTGYQLEGYYTSSNCTTKVATPAGALQPSVSVSATAWTNSSSQWVRGARETIYANWTPRNYILNLDSEGGEGGSENVTVTYDSNTHTSITNPTKEGYEFGGWYSGDDGTGELVINTSGVLQNSVTVSATTWTDGSGNWKKTSTVTLYAKWTANDYKLTVGSPKYVTIKATPEGASDITEGNYTDVTCGNVVELNAVVDDGYTMAGWKITKDADGTDVTGTYLYDEETMFMPPFDATVTALMYSDLVFSCAELTLAAHPETEGAPIFITSVAEKKVRSQGYITITGSGLTPSQALTFPDLDSKFEVKAADGTAISTDGSGNIDVNAYIFYTPNGEATTDGLDKIAGITVSVGGAKPKQVSLTQSIIGRHLPTAGYVIAGKKDNKWYALPSNMASTSTPAPSEIAVDDINNPSIAYTDASNIYGLEGPTTSGGGNNIASGYGQYVRLTMSIESSSGSGKPAPLFGTSGSEDASNSPKVGKSGPAIATNNLSEGWWWELKQTNTSITNPQDAKYTIKCANNNHTLSIKNSPFVWGLYASGVEELRLIPASNIPFTEAYFVEWGQHGGVIEVDAANAGGTGQAATSVVAHLGEATSSAITLSQTGTSGGKSSKYNYTVNFGDGIDFAASTSNGAMLTLEWKNGETVKAISNIVVPKIIALSATMKSIMSGDAQWETEVHVLPDVTLTANAGDFESNDVMIKQLEIYPGATVVVTKGEAGSGTLKVKTLVLRNGWTCASGTRKYDVAQLYITPSTASLAKNAVGDVWYMDWYIDYDQYYPIAVPWKVAVNSSNIVHRYTSNAATFGPSGSIRLRYYDGEQRATSGQSMIGQNWKDYGKSGNEDLPDYLEPSKGYSFSAKRPSGKAFSIVRMTLGIPSNDWTALGEQGEVSGTHKDQVSVTGWGKGTADWYAMGWNFIGNPYMCTFNGDDGGISGKLELQNGGSIKYATIPSIDFSNYDQVAIADADLKPARGFFIQANNAEAQNITFNASKIVDPTAAPARYMTQTEAIPEQEAYIRLSYEGGKDQMGLIIGEDYTEAYEVNADLAKVLGDAGFVKTYMQYGGMDMAYVAINQELAKAWIPVTVILPKDGEYTFSLMSSSEVEQLEGVYLIDYAENETVTNLIDKDYTFVADAATISNRFAINAIIGERQTPTDIDVINEGGDLNSDRPFKFIYHDKVYIYHRGVIYDATGKRVREINK